jgi:hypothetical protein
MLTFTTERAVQKLAIIVAAACVVVAIGHNQPLKKSLIIRD